MRFPRVKSTLPGHLDLAAGDFNHWSVETVRTA